MAVDTWTTISLKAMGIGVALWFAICLGHALFISLVTLGIANIFYFARAALENRSLEHMLVALAGGILIGIICLAGLLACC
jgi:hypothetical protein